MKKFLIILLLLALIMTGAILGYNAWYQNTHVFVENEAFRKDTAFLDLRGSGTSLEYYEALREQLPDCEIRYDLPFQGAFYPDDTTELTITSLTDEEVVLLDYLPNLTAVNAMDCQDYAQLIALQKRRPDCKVTYSVTFLEEEYTQDAQQMQFAEKQPQLEELLQVLPWLPDIKTIHIDQPTMPAEDLIALQEAYPEIELTWVKDAFGTTYNHDVTEIELTDMYFASLDEVEEAVLYFPSLEKLVMLNCGYDKNNLFDDETMAAFREKMRPHCKVVWSFKIYSMTVRTDDTYFMPNKYGVNVSNYQVQRLRYCEDMLCVDLGHHPIVDLSFLEGMPHLKYFICIDSPLIYIEPISNCKELIYCELFWTEVSDFTPLLECTALEDLNVARTNGDPLVFKDMPWLKNLWIPSGNIRKAEDRETLEAALPDTHIQYCSYDMTRNGWRDLQNYFDMRDLLGMSYNTW